jgi:hypothetical protein
MQNGEFRRLAEDAARTKNWKRWRSYLAERQCRMYPLATAVEGLVEVKSPCNAKDIMNRLEEIVQHRGLAVFARTNKALIGSLK